MSNQTVMTESADQSARWTAWIALGAERDRKAQKWFLVTTITVVVVLAARLVTAFAVR